MTLTRYEGITSRGGDNADQLFYTSPVGGTTAGQACQVGQQLVVAMETTAAGTLFHGSARGVYLLAKATGIAWTEGMLVYWDNAAKNLTNVPTGNVLVGSAAQAQLAGDTIGLVRLNGAASQVAVSFDDIVLSTTAPSNATATTFVQTTGTQSKALAAGLYIGQTKRFIQSVAATTPVGTITGAFKQLSGAAAATLSLGTAVATVADFVWDGAAWRLTSALGGTASSLV